MHLLFVPLQFVIYQMCCFTCVCNRSLSSIYQIKPIFFLVGLLTPISRAVLEDLLYGRNNVSRITLNYKSLIFFLIFCWPCISIYLFLNINQLDALNFIISLFQASTCFEHNQLDALNFIISLFQACTCFEHMCSKHVQAWNKLIINFSASSWLILRNKLSLIVYFLWNGHYIAYNLHT